MNVAEVLEERRPVAKVAASMGVSRRTVYEWMQRCRACGGAGRLEHAAGGAASIWLGLGGSDRRDARRVSDNGAARRAVLDGGHGAAPLGRVVRQTAAGGAREALRVRPAPGRPGPGRRQAPGGDLAPLLTNWCAKAPASIGAGIGNPMLSIDALMRLRRMSARLWKF